MLIVKQSFENNRFKKHFHTFYSIGLILDGSYEIEIEKKELSVQKGKIKIINPFETHIASGKWEYINIMIKPETIRRLAKSLLKTDIPFIKFEHSLYNPEAIKHLNSLLISKEKMEKDENLTLFLSELIKQNSNISFKEITSKINKSIEFIKTHFLEDISLEEIASYSNISKYHFIRMFSQEKGMTPYQYILSLRLEHALCLIDKNVPFSIAAHASGFSDQSHFIKVFKRHFGFTPINFKNRQSF